jgi:23S rRNA (guanosine2251-2'-O)-methyltransferase
MQRLDKKQIKKKYKEYPKRTQTIYLLLENIEYARNVAAIFRTADAARVGKIFLTGISFQPPFGKDLVKASRHKEKSIPWEYEKDSAKAIQKLKQQGFEIVGIELTDSSMDLSELQSYMDKHEKVCFVAGSEVYGIVKTTLEKLDTAVQIPMYGKGASLNVGMSVGIVLFSFK